jgi:hypothetical protein
VIVNEPFPAGCQEHFIDTYLEIMLIGHKCFYLSAIIDMAVRDDEPAG